MSSPVLEECTTCGASAGLVRLISGGGAFIFKGDGFYANDYKRSHKIDNVHMQREKVRDYEMRRGER